MAVDGTASTRSVEPGSALQVDVKEMLAALPRHLVALATLDTTGKANRAYFHQAISVLLDYLLVDNSSIRRVFADSSRASGELVDLCLLLWVRACVRV